MRVFGGIAAVALAAAPACGGAGATGSVALEFRPDVALAAEAYVCFGFDAGPVRERGIAGIEWEHPAGAVVLHHAKLYAVPTPYPPGPIPCDQQPTGAVPLHTWLPGSGALAMPAGVLVALPEGAVSLVIEAHVLRTADGPAPLDRARVALAGVGDSIRAGWTAGSGIVPALRPHHVETSTDACTLTAAFHVYFAWPHMHLLGRDYRAIVTTSTGPVTLLDVASWNFSSEEPAAHELDLAAGDVVSVTCSWNNTTDAYVLPGPRTTDEMCGLGMIVSPPIGARLPCAANSN